MRRQVLDGYTRFECSRPQLGPANWNNLRSDTFFTPKMIAEMLEKIVLLNYSEKVSVHFDHIRPHEEGGEVWYFNWHFLEPGSDDPVVPEGSEHPGR